MEILLARLLCFALLGSGSEAGERATQTTPHGPVSREAQSIVRVLEARYHSARTLKAIFLERYHEGGRDVRAESGTVYFSRPGRMRWEYESPEPKLFVADGRTVWFYVPADRTVTRAQMKESADWRTPLALLTGKAKLSSLCSGIEVVPRGEQGLARGRAAESSQPADVVVLRCLPRGETPTVPSRALNHYADIGEGEGSFHEVLLEVDVKGGDLARVLVRQAGGVELEYRFGNWQQNLPLPEAMFHFQAPAGVAIVEESSITGRSP